MEETEENQQSQQYGKCFDEAGQRALGAGVGAEEGEGAEAASWKKQVGRDF